MNNEKLIKEVIIIKEKISSLEKNIVTKKDANELKTILEELAIKMNRIEEQNLMTNEWVQKLTKDIEKHEQKIQKFELQLKTT